MSRIRKHITLSMLSVFLFLAPGCGHGTVHISSDPPEQAENWDGDIDRIRHEKQRATQK